MKSLFVRIAFGALSGLFIASQFNAAPADEPTSQKTSPPEGSRVPKKEKIARVSLEVARDRAQLLQQVYASTLDVMHHRYFHQDRATVPARAMEDIFDDMRRKSIAEARWIAVSLKPMSLNHEAESDFEKHAVKEIKSGKKEVETIDDGYYRRAVSIPLTGGCITCHDGFFRQSSPSAMYAGLVISIPVTEGSALPSDESTKK